ncbi:DEKNAAC101706 [Brettanomyces naardenensis]|uniref:Kynurenine 3-monooxygenase n=1 Tax=Brettanomyces naardenensis TaxID=13370 RepID=A0A448YIW6_BRENA|nr:DEKNAAC101706 [Brettanomyces naardenensis]
MAATSTTAAVIGIGPVGSLAALGLAHKGYQVSLFDFRPDPRDINDVNLRSINLAVSDRGITAMKYVDQEMADRLLKGIIPMYGRMIHDLKGNQESQKYGLFREHINSIDRGKLNEDLVSEVERYNKSNPENRIQLNFKCKFTNFHADDSGVTIEYSDAERMKRTAKFDFVVGADGCYSRVRSALMKYIRMDYKQFYIDMCYLELSIPPGPKGSFRIDANHLHIWPRKNFMLIALPNGDGSFTSTFFGPWKLTESLNKKELVEQFFSENFEDAVDLIGMDKIVEAFLDHPKGALMPVTCNQYHYSDKCIIIGDAAHSMVPFYGQGMNCGFEDIRVLLQLLDKHDQDRKLAFDEYTATRHKDLLAILELALNNYYEMSTKVQSPRYLIRKRLDGILGRLIPKYWIPLYTMVSFRADIPYSDCIRIEERQQTILKGLEYALVAGATLAGVYLAKRR